MDAYAAVKDIQFFTSDPGVEPLSLNAQVTAAAIDGSVIETHAIIIEPIPEQPRTWKQAIIDAVVSDQRFSEFNIMWFVFQDLSVEKP